MSDSHPWEPGGRARERGSPTFRYSAAASYTITRSPRGAWPPPTSARVRARRPADVTKIIVFRSTEGSARRPHPIKLFRPTAVYLLQFHPLRPPARLAPPPAPLRVFFHCSRFHSEFPFHPPSSANALPTGTGRNETNLAPVQPFRRRNDATPLKTRSGSVARCIAMHCTLQTVSRGSARRPGPGVSRRSRK